MKFLIFLLLIIPSLSFSKILKCTSNDDSGRNVPRDDYYFEILKNKIVYYKNLDDLDYGKGHEFQLYEEATTRNIYIKKKSLSPFDKQLCQYNLENKMKCKSIDSNIKEWVERLRINKFNLDINYHAIDFETYEKLVQMEALNNLSLSDSDVKIIGSVSLNENDLSFDLESPFDEEITNNLIRKTYYCNSIFQQNG